MSFAFTVSGFRHQTDRCRFHRSKINPAQTLIVVFVCKNCQPAAGGVFYFNPERFYHHLLNYGYGVLYRNVEGALIKSGIDPYIGVLHRDEYNRPVLVYDVIELYRVWVDYVVVSFISQNVITDEYYSVGSDGSHWLEPLGRRILIQALNDYLEETIEVQGVTRSRRQQIFLYAQDLAQQFKRVSD